MSISRNLLFLIIGALVVTAGVLGYNLYQAKKQPDGLQINVGPNGLKFRANSPGRAKFGRSKKFIHYQAGQWRARKDLNLRPSELKSDALSS